MNENQEMTFEETAVECRLEFRGDYSGRGMFGVKTVGVVGSLNDLFGFLEALGVNLERNGEKPIGNFALDNMGKDFILYVHR